MEWIALAAHRRIAGMYQGHRHSTRGRVPAPPAAGPPRPPCAAARERPGDRTGRSAASSTPLSRPVVALSFAAAEPTQGTTSAETWQIVGGALLFFVLFAWIGWPRREAAAARGARQASAFESHLVPLAECGSAAEAEDLARRLRERGIAALAKVEVHPRVRGGEYFVSRVVVVSTELGRAQDVLAAMSADELPPEGEVPAEEIERELAAAADDEEADDEDAERTA